MGKLISLSFGLCLTVLSACSSGPGKHAPMSAVASFDVEQYSGKWHQIAAVPAWFQRGCVGKVTAEYSRRDNGQIQVVNSCDEKDGSRNIATGQARFQGADNIGKLDVSFVRLLGTWVWPFGGNYWIIGLDESYRWSIVGEPSRKYGWILSRTDELDAATLIQIASIIEREDYDTCDFIFSTPTRQGRLCDDSRASPQ